MISNKKNTQNHPSSKDEEEERENLKTSSIKNAGKGNQVYFHQVVKIKTQRLNKFFVPVNKANFNFSS